MLHCDTPTPGKWITEGLARRSLYNRASRTPRRTIDPSPLPRDLACKGLNLRYMLLWRILCVPPRRSWAMGCLIDSLGAPARKEGGKRMCLCSSACCKIPVAMHLHGDNVILPLELATSKLLEGQVKHRGNHLLHTSRINWNSSSGFIPVSLFLCVDILKNTLAR